MFDAETARILRSAPELSGLKAEDIPQLLTKHYAELVSARLGAEETPDSEADPWPLGRIADAYEIIASISSEEHIRRPSAFVAGTAQQILARKAAREQELTGQRPELVTRDGVDPVVSAPLLFLIADQHADASESAAAIRAEEQPHEVVRLVNNIKSLARGRVLRMAERGQDQPELLRSNEPLEKLAFFALLNELSNGIEHLARCLVGLDNDWEAPRLAFERVARLSTSVEALESHELGGYPGPRHLASLLLGASDALRERALIRTPPPEGVDPEFWWRWIKFRAGQVPFVWPNHAEFLRLGFQQPGTSAVLVLPTGAGKTTVSAIKMAAVLAANKRVIFLAPTHALVEQLSGDLQEIFPEDLLGDQVSIEFDLSTDDSSGPAKIEVMTPEACLTGLCYSPARFADVGLLVFDECHLLSQLSGRSRRALDSMLCLLAFVGSVPEADLLFLSAMLKNGPEFSRWVRSLTGRQCIAIDDLWKPSRQARGVVAYDAAELAEAIDSALQIQHSLDAKKGRRAEALRSRAQAALQAKPLAIWGLRHNWLSPQGEFHISIHSLLGRPVRLGGALTQRGKHIRLLPNVNEVAASIAVEAAKKGLKTIVFVNNKSHTFSTARAIEKELPQDVVPTGDEQTRWGALVAELGELKHSVLNGPSSAVPHNASMLRLERDLAQRMYARSDGAKVIVATPTLAQGLNLPAHLAILAGDRRTDPEQGGRADLEAHEILNAAARAGRAGHLANGVVLLLPDPVVSVVSNRPNKAVAEKLQAVLPEDDRCVELRDPLELVLDRISSGVTDADVSYIINRLAAFRREGEAGPQIFDIRRSFVAFSAQASGNAEHFETQVEALQEAINAAVDAAGDQLTAELASRSGLPMPVIGRLRDRLEISLGSLPNTVFEWVVWVVDWLADDGSALDSFFGGIAESVNGAAGISRATPLDNNSLRCLLPGIAGWLEGRPLSEIEFLLGGNPESTTQTERVCPRARELANTVMHRGFSYLLSLVTAVAKRFDPHAHQNDFSIDVLDNLAAAARRGFDSPQKVRFALRNAGVLSRVQLHEQFHAEEVDF